MIRIAAIAVGAGVASALLFIVSATASLAAVMLAYLTPLPIIIAAMGFGHRSGIVAALVGGSTIAIALGPVPGAIFLAILGLPAWWLSYLCLLARAPLPGAPDPQSGPEWYPIAAVATWIAVLSASPVLIVGGVLVLRYGGYDAAVGALAGRLGAIFSGRDPLGSLTFADLVRMAPIAMAASTVLMLSFNLWLGGRIVLMSQRLTRPWPILADSLHLPKPAAAALVLLLGAAVLPDPAGLAAEVLAAAFGMIFVFDGLAAAHVLTRGLTARRLILGSIYAAVFVLMPYPLVALALIGCLDSLFALRGKMASKVPHHPTNRS